LRRLPFVRRTEEKILQRRKGQTAYDIQAMANIDEVALPVPKAAATALIPTEPATHLDSVEQFQLEEAVRITTEPGAGAQPPIITGVRNLNAPFVVDSSCEEEQVVSTRVLPVLPSSHDVVELEDRLERG
jgi:hypothetical protein